MEVVFPPRTEEETIPAGGEWGGCLSAAVKGSIGPSGVRRIFVARTCSSIQLFLHVGGAWRRLVVLAITILQV
jgi:hypothetical protein